ncbi:MAG: hypothetical protein ACYDA8_02140 [Deferrisomatales bacterium]
MAVEHTFRTVGGQLKTAMLTPIKAIREQCVACVNSPYAVVDCRGDLCSLFPFRLGDAHTVGPEQRKRLAEARKARLAKKPPLG